KRNYLYMVFLQKTPHELITENTAFQSNNANSLKIMEDLIILLKNYSTILIPHIRLEKISNQELMSFYFSNYVMSGDFLNFGYTFNEASMWIKRLANRIPCIKSNELKWSMPNLIGSRLRKIKMHLVKQDLESSQN
ncbi:hypothetical protein PV328_011984, partial [Microctonus aethiopoides]